MKCTSQAKHQIKLQINIQKPISPKITAGISPQLNSDFLDRKQGFFFRKMALMHFFFKKIEEEFLFELSLVPKEFLEKYRIVEHLGKVKLCY